MISCGKNTVLMRVTLLLSVVAFLQGYMTASSHFMVNHMDAVFRLNQPYSDVDYTKNKHKVHLQGRQEDSASVIVSSSIITNFHYVYASDEYPQTEGSSLSHSKRFQAGHNTQPHEYLFHTHGFSSFSRGWVVWFLLGQALGSGIAWMFADSIGRKSTILYATVSVVGLLGVQVFVTPDMGTFSIFDMSPSSQLVGEDNLQEDIVNISFSTSFYVISWGLRCLLGVPLGILLVTAILYAAELPLPQERGSYMAYLPLAYLVGTWLALLMTLSLHDHVDASGFSFLVDTFSGKKSDYCEYRRAIQILGNEWRWHLLFPFLSCVVVLVGFETVTNWLILTPESPCWLLAHDSTTMTTSKITSASSKKKFATSKIPQSNTTRMDAFSSLLLLRGGGKSPAAMREVSLEFSNMYRALAQDAVSDQSWRDLCLGTTDISLRYRLLLICILLVAQVFLGPHLLFEMSRRFSLLILGKDPFIGGDDDENDQEKFVHDYKLSHSSIWLSFYPSDTYLFEGLLTSCVLLSAIGGVLIGRAYLDPVVLRSGYSRGESIGRRSLLLSGMSFIVIFVVLFVVTIHFHEWRYDEFISMRSLLWEYLVKYLCFGWLCFICIAYYASIGLTMWILPVEIWGLRYRAKCLSSGYVLYYCILCVAYIFSFWIHPDGATERTLDEEALVAPSSLQRSLLEYAALLTLVGVYVFLALPETTGLMFEDSDELFSLEEYDVVGYCFPRGTGSGYLGFRTFEQINLRFHIYFVAANRRRPSQLPTSTSSYPPQPTRNSSINIANIPSGAPQPPSISQQSKHPPVPISQHCDQRFALTDSNSSSLASQLSPQSSSRLLGIGSHMNLYQDRSNVLPGYGSISSTPTAVNPTAGSLQLPSPSQDSMGESQQLLQNLYGSALYLPDMLDEQDNDDHMFHEHKYSTVLRSCGFQYDDDEEGQSIHTSALFHTESANNSSSKISLHR